MTLRVVFMGSPEFAVPTLLAIHDNFNLVGVVTQQDKPKGRGQKTHSTPVKVAALQMGVPIFEPDTLNNEDFVKRLTDLNPDAIVVAAYGKILPERVLNIPPMGCINLHASLLPRHRGASPIQAAIMAGDKITGVCTILMNQGMDTGDILLSRETPIQDDDTAGSLHDRLMTLGASLVIDTLKGLMEKRIQPFPQDHSKATYTSLLSVKDAQIKWNNTAEYLDRLIRAMNPKPGAYFILLEEQIKVWKAIPLRGSFTPGLIESIIPDGIVVGASQGKLLIKEVQPPGKKKMPAVDFARGRRLAAGVCLKM